MENIVVPHQKIDVLDCIFDRKNSGTFGWEQSDAMMRAIKSQIDRVAGPIAYLGTEHFAPDRNVPLHTGRADDDILETCYARVPACEISPPGIHRPHHKLQAIAAEVFEPQHGLCLAQLAFLRRPRLRRNTEASQLGTQVIQICRITHFQSERLMGVDALTEDEGVIAKIRAKCRDLLCAVDRLETEHILSERRGLSDLLYDQTNIAQLLDQLQSPQSKRRHTFLSSV